ncbi:response regulator transcription factor [soil metagenome]
MSKPDVGRREGQAIALVLLDEHPLTRVGVRNVLEAESDIHVVAETDSVDEAVAACRRHGADVVLLDVDLAPADMIETIRRLREECKEPAVVVLTHEDSDSELFNAAFAGAAAHLSDAVQPAELTRAIRRAASGDPPLGESIAERPEVGRRVLETFREMAAQDPPATAATIPSDRQREILEHAARGLTNQQIGRLMGLSSSTIRSDVSELLRRLRLHHRTQAVVHAVREGWIALPSREPSDHEDNPLPY